MGCLVRCHETNKCVYYLKGAEIVMKKRCKIHEDELEAICDDIARDGLRTLVFAQKVITNEQAEKFLEKYKEANERLKGRKAAVDKVLK